MHDCPDCGQACYCDGDDTFFEDNGECEHDCAEMDYTQDPDNHEDGD